MNSRRRGFTLTEVLVVICIISVMVALLLFAIPSAREASRRVQCQTKMRNVASGLVAYTDRNNAFPPAGVFFEDPRATDPTTSVLASALGNPGGIPATALNRAGHSWVVEILADLGHQDIYNSWTFPFTYWATGSSDPTQPPNIKLSSTSLEILRCPDDNNATAHEGNLSYVVNGGFTRFPAYPLFWNGFQFDGVPANGGPQTTPLIWDPGGTFTSTFAQSVGSKLGVMYVNSIYSQDYETAAGTGNTIPSSLNNTSPAWGGTKMVLAGIVDGTSQTLLLGENTLVGFSKGSNWSGGITTNWSTPLPNFCMFNGGNVCGASGQCNTMFGTAANYSTVDDNAAWLQSNRINSYENISYGQNLTTKGTFPFATSGHPAGCNFAFCDGTVRFIKNTIDGVVYSKLITPAGSRLPVPYKQLPLDEDAFVP
jgi:prepilin-type N-terminal cleavage/methylation domain-containing protein/prepilin-type processing-associated H-X9-DG protein